jgi:putative transcriptional regulator
MMRNEDIKAGKLLCSKPYIGDPYFERSVILITRHDKLVTEGLILNNLLDLKNPEALEYISAFSDMFYLGGPVDADHCYFLHRRPDVIPNAIHVANDIYFGGHPDKMESILNSGKIARNDIRFYIGISVWSPGQLHMEIENNTWFLHEEDPGFSALCAESTDELWVQIVAGKGAPYNLYIHGPERPDLN